MRERCRSATVRPDIRLLRTVLESNDGFAVLGEAADGAETVRLVAELRPDVVVLDLAMPVMDGLQALAEIRRRSPATKVVVFSGYGEDQAAAQALELGAAAYLEKGGEIRALITLLSDLFPGRLGHALTAREWAVLRLVADGAPAETIARRLGISHRTVHKHLEHLYRKLGVHDRAAAVRVASSSNACDRGNQHAEEGDAALLGRRLVAPEYAPPSPG